MNVTKKVNINGMQCNGCETIIEETLAHIPGIYQVHADYAHANINVSFDTSKTSLAEIGRLIAAKGYAVKLQSNSSKKQRFFKIGLTILFVGGVILLMLFSRELWQRTSIPEINSHTGNGMIFIVGLISGLHCIGMCGNFVLGYTVKDVERGHPAYRSHISYGLGKTLSYALFGGLFGFLGSLFTITPFMGGVSAIVAGLFLMLFGLNMLNILSPLKHIRIKQPEAMARFAMAKRRQSRSPFFIGFFSGFLLGCGPLQAMYVLAAGNGNPVEGATMLTLFGLGTLPALLSFGWLARKLSSVATQYFMRVSAIVLIIMGVMMLDKGLIRTESGYNFKSILHKALPAYFPDESLMNVGKRHSCH
ncbi:MAG: sulfite exporter TauE/SafE family protein [Methyloglobulus sp.]|nr:heavy metal transport/detoxification protein [Methyloglobulus sp.]